MLQTISMATMVMVGPRGTAEAADAGVRAQPLPKPPSGTHQPIDTSVVVGSLGPYDPAAPPGKAGQSDTPAANIHK